MGKRITLIFDGDDTLWKTHFIYKKVKFETASLLNSLGFEIDKDDFANKVDELSVHFAKKAGFSSARFPTALTETYDYFCKARKISPDLIIRKKIWKLGESVATTKPTMMPKAREVLIKLSKNFDCILYTLGNETEQQFRINAMGLNRCFKEVFIVLKKDGVALRKIIRKLSLDPKSTWMIGNSANNDIKPAFNAGLNCIWMHTEHWLLDETELDVSDIYEVSSLSEIPPIIEAWALRSGSYE